MSRGGLLLATATGQRPDTARTTSAAERVQTSQRRWHCSQGGRGEQPAKQCGGPELPWLHSSIHLWRPLSVTRDGRVATRPWTGLEYRASSQRAQSSRGGPPWVAVVEGEYKERFGRLWGRLGAGSEQREEVENVKTLGHLGVSEMKLG